MKKCILLIFAVLFLSCESSTFEEISDEMPLMDSITYSEHVKPIIDGNCIECHSPGGISSFRPLTNYEEVRQAVLETNLLDRIQRQNGEEGQMPQTGRMPQNLINTILIWNDQGLLE